MEAEPEYHEHENDKVVIGIFEKPWAGIELVLELIRAMRKVCDDQRKVKEKLREEMKVLDKRVNSEVDVFDKKVVRQIQKYWKLIRTDFLTHQSKKMDMHKQIQSLRKSKLDLIENIKIENERILAVEDDLFKCEMFKMSNQVDGKHIHKNASMILRKQQTDLADYKNIVSLDIDSQSGVKKVKEVQFEQNHIINRLPDLKYDFE